MGASATGRAEGSREGIAAAPDLTERLVNQYHDHPHWSYKLHYDNLGARVKADASARTVTLLLDRAAIHGRGPRAA